MFHSGFAGLDLLAVKATEPLPALPTVLFVTSGAVVAMYFTLLYLVRTCSCAYWWFVIQGILSRICWLHNFNNACVSKLSFEVGVTKATTANQVTSGTAELAVASK